MRDLVRWMIRAAAVAFALAPFAIGVPYLLDENIDPAVVLVYVGYIGAIAFFTLPALLAGIVWWLAGFIRYADDDT